jgi:hypothetical protein
MLPAFHNKLDVERADCIKGSRTNIENQFSYMESGTRAGPAFLRQEASAITRTQLAGDAA